MLSKRFAATLVGCGVLAAMILLLPSAACLGQDKEKHTQEKPVPTHKPPSGHIAAPAEQSEIKWQPFSVTADDGVKTHALWSVPPGKGPFPLVVFIHGAPGGIGEEALRKLAAAPRWQEFVQAGFLVCVADYRGHPQGKPFAALQGNVNASDDVVAIVRHLKSLPQVDAKRVGIMGASLGGAVTLEALAKEDVACAVLNAPATFLFLGFRGRPGGNKDRELGDEEIDKKAALARIDKIRCPVLIIQGTADGLTPLNKKLAALMKEAKKDVRLELFEGQGHGFTNGPEGKAYRKALKLTIEFLAKHTTAPSSHNSTPPTIKKVELPHGIFSSSVDRQALGKPFVKGALVRGPWDAIEAKKGDYNFTILDDQIKVVKQAGKQWSLAVYAGPHTPTWWGAKRVQFEWRGTKQSIPAPWDEEYLKGLEKMAAALAEKYAKDKDLKLVYLPLISPNGIEGAWVDGTPSWKTLGYTADKHAQAVLKAVDIVARVFPAKAIAVELHEVNRSTEVPLKIIAGLDKSQVGIAIWWLGQGTYQPALQKVFKEFNGAKYGQIIASEAREPDPKRGYRLRGYDNQPWGLKGVYQQAQDLGLRYVEAWPIDIKKYDHTFKVWSLPR